MYIFLTSVNNNIGDKMKKEKIREKCGDCFYNGNCLINLKDCFFLKKKKPLIEES